MEPRVEEICLPHLAAAYGLARWLSKNEHDAEDLVQEALLRAVKYGHAAPPVENARGWFLRIVRNCFYTSRGQTPRSSPLDAAPEAAAPDSFDPAELALRSSDRQLVHEALQELGDEAREILVLRELQGLAYREIAVVISVPIGTVMSRLSRAREALGAALARRLGKEARHEL